MPRPHCKLKGYPFDDFKSMGLKFDICRYFFSVESLNLRLTTHYKYDDSAPATYCALRGDYSSKNRRTTQATCEIGKKFEETGVVTNMERLVYYRFTRSAKNIAIVCRMCHVLFILRN